MFKHPTSHAAPVFSAAAFAALVVAAGVAGPALAQDAGATATMMTADGADAGTVTLIEGPHGVLIEADLTGLEPGEHGFHIHETGACNPDFGEAGDHFNPTDDGHGLLAEGGAHAGDLPNIFVGDDGTAKASFYDTRITLGEDKAGADSLMDDDGAAMMVHAKADTYGEEAGAGDRAACGVIEPTS